MRGKAAVPLLCAGALALLLSGCSALGFLFGSDQGEVDLVVVNDSARAVYAISLDAGDWSETVSSADGFPLLERGESYGLSLEEGTEDYTLELLGKNGRTLARWQGRFHGERQELTLSGGGTIQLNGGEREGMSP